MYSLEEIRKAIRLYNYLLEKGQLSIDDEVELFYSFSESSIKQILVAFEEETNVSIKKYDDTIYFIPNVDNEFLGYKRAEIKKELFSRSDMLNIDLYLGMYIMIQLTSEFYSGKGATVKIRDLIQIGELDHNITSRLELFRDSDDTSVNETTGLAMTDIASHWFSLKNIDDETTVKTRRWYIAQVINFLKKEKLITVQDETVIIPTTKFNRLAQNYFLNYDRLEDITNIFNRQAGDEDAEIK